MQRVSGKTNHWSICEIVGSTGVIMNTKVMDEILKNAPSEMRTLIGGLRTDENWAVYLYLYMQGFVGTTRGDMRKFFGITDEELQTHLHPLICCGLINQRATCFDDLFDYEKANYSFTHMGRELLPRLWDVIMPPEMREAAKRLKNDE